MHTAQAVCRKSATFEGVQVPSAPQLNEEEYGKKEMDYNRGDTAASDVRTGQELPRHSSGAEQDTRIGGDTRYKTTTRTTHRGKSREAQDDCNAQKRTNRGVYRLYAEPIRSPQGLRI